MNMNDNWLADQKIEFYRLLTDQGYTYFAAESEEAIFALLGLPEDPNCWGPYRGEKYSNLEKTTIEQARQASGFENLQMAGNLCADGTWILGIKKTD